MAFVFNIQTSGTDDTFTLPLTSNGTYNFTVDWGDGSTDDTITTWDDTARTHTYATEDEYTITITGTITGWSFYNHADAPMVRDVSDWGDLDVGDNNGWFYGCSNMTNSASNIFSISSVTDFRYAFRGCSSLTTLDVSSWDVSNVTNFGYAFRDCSSLTTLDVSSWDVSNVTNFRYAFYGCSGLTDVSSWDVSNVTNFGYAFRGCSSLTTLDVSSWDVSNVTDFGYAFYDCSGLTDEIYSKAIINWSQLNLQSDVSAHFGDAKYYKGAPARWRSYLETVLNWSITDGGQSHLRWPSNVGYIQPLIRETVVQDQGLYNRQPEWVWFVLNGAESTTWNIDGVSDASNVSGVENPSEIGGVS
jgi:surface protein